MWILSSRFCPEDHSEFRARDQLQNATAFEHVLLQLEPRTYHTIPATEITWTIIEQFIDVLQDEKYAAICGYKNLPS